MRTQHHDASHKGDPLARGSFTFRRMRPWQIWALGIIAVGGFVAAVVLG
jgi:hypothetical protein